MRFLTILIALGALAAASRADILFDSGGFEGYVSGCIVGQHGWFDADLDSGQPNRPATIADAAPQGHGRALKFDNLANTESPAAVAFGTDLVGRYRYVLVRFSYFREGNGLLNNLLWYATGSASTPWYGMAWNNGGAAPGQLLPAGFGAPGTSQTPDTWTSVALLYDIQRGLASEYVNGVALAEDVPVGTAAMFTGWVFNDQYDGTGAAAGQRAYVDDFRIEAGDAPLVPEPATLTMLACALPACWRLRRRVV